MRMREAILGPSLYEPRSPWGPVRALVVAELIAGVGVIAATVVYVALLFTGGIASETTRTGPNTFTITFKPPLALLMAVMQVSIVAATLVAVRWKGGGARETLALRAPAASSGSIAVVAATFLAVSLAVGTAIEWLAPAASSNAMRMFHDFARTSGWTMVFLIGCIGAPISEEILLRGFLLPALARSRLGFWGAAAVTSGVFAFAHALQYALVLLIPIFVIGMLLAWALRRTGSLYVSIGLHALNNIIALSTLWMWPPA